MNHLANRIWEVFWRFFSLGFISFGGPAAHIGYFQRTFVQQLQWVNHQQYAQLIALSQFLPGPGSSQLGFAIGLHKAGLWGGIAAFIGFTTPSFLLLYGLAVSSSMTNQYPPIITGMIHGLKLLAVVVVADACLSMFKNFCKTKLSIGIAIVTAATLLVIPSLWTQMLVLMVAALVAWQFHQAEPNLLKENTTAKLNWTPLILFGVLFLGLSFFATQTIWLQLASAFYQSGSLVFGGGHVVLPLLQHTLGDLVDPDRFLLGYAASQGVPGPMFTFSAFLGADLMPEQAFWGALLATLAIFLPGFLLLLSVHNHWQIWASKPSVSKMIWGVNAAVVGLLLAALYHPVFVNAVQQPIHMAMVLLGFFVLRVFKMPILLLLLGFLVLGAGLSILH